MHKTIKSTIAILIITILLSACGQPASPAEQASDKLTVSVSILPQKYLVERIGGELVNVNVMVGPGESPHSYEPKASQMTALSDSAAYFSIGVEFEDAWMDRIASANPEMEIIDLTQGINQIPSVGEHSHEEDADHEEHTDDDHEHDEEEGEEGHHDETEHADEMDPHIWTSPANGAVMAGIIADTLVTLDPDNAETYRENLDGFLSDIAQLQQDITTALEDLDTRKFIVFHPAWGYFAQEFDLEQIPIEVAGNEPSAAELAGLITEAKEENITVIFAQPEFSTRSADYIASEIGGKVVLISPLAENWLDNLNNVAQTFSEEL